MAKLLATTSPAIFLSTLISLLSCLELASSDTFHHRSSSVAAECTCSERYYEDTTPYHAIVCHYINSTKRVMCAKDFMEGLSKDGSSLQLEYYFSNVGLFPVDFLSGLSIITLSFHSCNITDIPFDVINAGCINVTMLNFNGNDISTIREGGLDCPKLKHLFFPNNNIKSISPHAFQNLGNLLVLDLQLNNLDSLPNFPGLTNLEELYVSQNEIVFVSNETFIGYGNMKLVYLVDNYISHIETGTFDPLTNPHIVMLLQGNPFDCDCSLKWLQDWANKHNTDEPRCATKVKGRLKSVDFCPESSWIFRWK